MFQKVVLIGNLGRDPEVKHINGEQATSFSIATTQKRKGGEETIWFNVLAWGSLGELCMKYLAKGRQVYIEGSLGAPRAWIQDGQARASFDVRANTVQFLGAAGERTNLPADNQPALAERVTAAPARSRAQVRDQFIDEYGGDEVPF